MVNFLKNLILCLTIVILIPTSKLIAEDCEGFDSPITYSSKTRGEVFLFNLQEKESINVTNLMCAFGSTFFQNVRTLPNKSTIGVIDKSGTVAAFIKWDLKEDYFMIIQVSNDVGVFTKFPKALDRITDVLIGNRFPKVEDFPEHLKNKYTQNTIKVSKEQLNSLILQ